MRVHIFCVLLLIGTGNAANFRMLRQTSGSLNPLSFKTPMGPSGQTVLNPFAAQSQMNTAGFSSQPNSQSQTQTQNSNSTSANKPGGKPFSSNPASGQMSTSGFTSGNPGSLNGPSGSSALNPFSAQAGSGQQSTSGFNGGNPLNQNPGAMSGAGNFDPNKFFQNLLGKRFVRRQAQPGPPSGGSSSGGSSTGGSSSPSGSSSGGSPGGSSSGGSPGGSSSGGSPSGGGSGSSGGGSSGGSQMSQNVQPPSFLINPAQFMMGGSSSGGSPSSGGSGGSSSGGSSGGSGGGSSSGSGGGMSPPSSGGSGGGSNSPQIPKFDPNKVNNIQSSFLDPSKSMLGQSGGGGGGFNPDTFNSQSFSFFNPGSMMGGGSGGGSSGGSGGGSSGGSTGRRSLRLRRQSQTGGSSSGSSPPKYDANAVNKPVTNFLDPSNSQLGKGGGGGGGFDPDQVNTMKFNFFNPNAMTGGGGGGSGGGSGSGSSGGGSSGGGSGGGGSSSSIPKFNPNTVNQINANMLDPSTSKLGASGGGGGGFDPDQFNSQSFSFFNPANQLGRRRRQSQTGGGSSGGSSPPSYDPNAVNKPVTNFLDPSNSQLGKGGGGGGGFDPDQFNSMKFNFFNPNAMTGGGGGGSGGSGSGSGGSSGGGGSGGSSSNIPKYDPNSVNKINANMLDPSSSKLGTSGGAAGGFDPDQFNSQAFNFFNPKNLLG